MDDTVGEGLLQCIPKAKPAETGYNAEKQGLHYFKVENISCVRPPLLKVYYWRRMGIDKLNARLSSADQFIEHELTIPTRHLNTKPLKIIFWLRNQCEYEITLRSKRVKNCQCQPIQTRVGFNQFRQLYHCPHRHLVTLTREIFKMKPHELVAMSMVTYFYLYGNHVLTYELKVSDNRVIRLHFNLNIVTFDPIRSILTRTLVPVNMQEPRRMSQSIWVRNITMQTLHFRFIARDRGLRLINPDLVVPRQSVWPLIVDYRPSEEENELTLVLALGGFRYNIPLTCKGTVGDFYPEPDGMPISDYESVDFSHVVYPNKLEFIQEINEDRSQLVSVHNYGQKCMDFKWQTYCINGYIKITFEPQSFTLKPHHSKLCVVHCKSFDKPLHFRRIPAVLEVHRILDKATQIARNLLEEVESIDDPKWGQSSYFEHVFLHVDLKVKFPTIEPFLITEKFSEKTEDVLNPAHKYLLPYIKPPVVTIFEKLFWEYLSHSNFMRNTSKIPRNLTYDEVLGKATYGKCMPKMTDSNKSHTMSLICEMVAESCRDLSANYRFLPKDCLKFI